MSQRGVRQAGLALTILSAAVFLTAVGSMAFRLRAHYASGQAPPNQLWWLQRTAHLEQRVDGRLLRVEPIRDEETGATTALRVVWGEASAVVPVGGAVVEELPDLRRYSSWFALLRTAPGATEEEAKAAEREGRSTLLAVVRTPPPGFDPKTWGAARYKDWRYIFLTLTPDGAIERSEATYRQLAAEPRSMHFAAAMQVTPGLFTPGMRSASPLTYPNYKPVRDDLRAMGWTWPAAGVSVLTLIAGGLLLASAGVRRPEGRGALGGVDIEPARA